ncbi:hypothetical protein SG34_010460 [Thalassomonas viridans]|uniref:Uncharacterized protein n=1 Tax=Thalassomonas viridans TaxID=137584 RepID=A0AAE9Z8K0_9GAMM|nr:hypothetical protein [Thalassomonas viridans]WDE07268.1 hypothetical protein SG34_010460 [Thalassomonas viridans]
MASLFLYLEKLALIAKSKMPKAGWFIFEVFCILTVLLIIGVAQHLEWRLMQ